MTAPITRADLRAMRSRLRDLKSELQDAAERRNSVANRLREADPDARPGYQARLQALDNRIVTIENEITSIVARMGTAPPSAVDAVAEVPPLRQGVPMDPGVVIPIFGMLFVFVLLPLSIGVSRFLWRRAQAPPRAPGVDEATQRRLDQLQQAVDTIAIEVERISEGQRFVTKVLSDRERIALGGGKRERGTPDA